MKHVTSLMSKKHMLLTLLILLCSMRVGMAANQIITINVATPGTLNTMMGETKKYAITALKLTGSINIDDIKFLREMAGCYHNWGKYPGKLEYLDLEDVTLDSKSGSSLDIYTNKRDYKKTVQLKDSQTLPASIFAYLDQLKTIILPSGIQNIENSVFYRDTSLTTVKLPYNLLSIGEYAFLECENLTDLTIPTFVEKIGEYTFLDCKYLKEVVISSDYITEIPTEAFASSGVDKIKLPANLERIGERAFIGAGRLGATEGFTIPSKVKEIGAEAFYKGFGYAAYLVLPASLKTVPIYAFAACHANVIYAYMSEPFALGDDDFDGYPRSECKLYVPKGCAKKYRQAEIWKEFDIEEMDGTGIEGVTNDSTVTEVSRYDANGNRLAVPTKGLNIVRYSDGTVKKVMVE